MATSAGEEPVRPEVIERVVRREDIDPKKAARAERQVAALFLLSALGTVGYIATYVTTRLTSIEAVRNSNVLFGVCMALSLGGLGAGIIHWSRRLMTIDEVVQDRHDLHSDAEEREEAVEVVKIGFEETGLPRRSLIKRTLAVALGLVALPAVVVLRDLGPLPERALRTTVWRKGDRLLDEVTRLPIKVGDIRIGGLMTVVPEGVENIEELSKAIVVLIRLAPGVNKPAPGRENWAFSDHVAYSKICTHVGCPVGLYEQQTHHLLCPCHQSTFDVPRACKVIFGPAARALPQLPITIDDDGYFIAQDGFDQPIGPSFWERG